MANETTSTPVAQTTAPTAQAAAPHEATTYNPKMPEPQVINGVKVYPTSYIPAKAELHFPKPMLVEMKEWHIEAVHIAVFFLVLIFLFISPWKRPNKR